MRFQGVGGESAAVMTAIAFVILALIAFPGAKFFLLGAVLIGSAVAVLLRFFRQNPPISSKFF
jgi:hypothetical protein